MHGRLQLQSGRGARELPEADPEIPVPFVDGEVCVLQDGLARLLEHPCQGQSYRVGAAESGAGQGKSRMAVGNGQGAEVGGMCGSESDA